MPKDNQQEQRKGVLSSLKDKNDLCTKYIVTSLCRADIHPGGERELAPDPQLSQFLMHLPVLFLKRPCTHTTRVVETRVIHSCTPTPCPPVPFTKGHRCWRLFFLLQGLSQVHSTAFQVHPDTLFGVLLHEPDLSSRGCLPLTGPIACQPCLPALLSSGYTLLTKSA